MITTITTVSCDECKKTQTGNDFIIVYWGSDDGENPRRYDFCDGECLLRSMVKWAKMFKKEIRDDH